MQGPAAERMSTDLVVMHPLNPEDGAITSRHACYGQFHQGRVTGSRSTRIIQLFHGKRIVTR
jgi:hypothetical protein